MSTSINKLIIHVDQSPSIARLVEFGKEQGYVTYDDILKIIPAAENDSDWLENAFGALINAGIQYIEDDRDTEAKNKGANQGDEVDDLVEDHSIWQEYKYYSTDTDDMVGMYFNDAARHDLLTIEQETELAKRIERGQGEPDFIPMLERMCKHLWNAYCAFAPGAVAPVESLLKHFEDEIQAHISQKKCPFR